MHPAIRTQADGFGDILSLETATKTPGPDRARQEFKKDADINVLMSRFGVGLPQRQPVYGDVDFDLDLHEAFTAVRLAEDAYRRMPDKLKEHFPTWQTLLTAVENGSLRILLNEAKTRLDPIAGEPPAAA